MRKNIYKGMITGMLAGCAVLAVSCRDDFSEVNTDPSAVTDADVAYLFAQGVLEFETSDYTYWFYQADAMYQYMQTLVSTGSVTSTTFDAQSLPGLTTTDVLKYKNEIAYARSEMTEENSNTYANYAAAMDVLCIYAGIHDTDFYGNIPYTEAANAMHGGTLTPQYDSVQDLYDLWINQLDTCITTFTTSTDQNFESAQDPIYSADATKWAKLANSLKLKIAVRLLFQDRSRALSIAEEVANASCGLIDGESDDFLFNKGTENTSSNDYVYHWSNGILQSVAGSQTMIDFMVNNRDPRVRFIFQKNDWNSKVVQLFFDAGRADDVPSYIMDNINYTVDSDGNYQFDSWKSPGEPWVRYYGLPLDFNAAQQAGTYGDWFDYSNQCRYDESYTYTPFSYFQQEQVYGRIDFTLPVASGDAVIEDTDDQPWYGMYLTTAEVNFYLAEFALLGASLPQSAEDYYNKALEASVEEYDRLANLNQIPYYGTTYNYDPNEAVIDLQSGEIEEMMSHEDYQLTGNTADDLEKIYLQEMIHFSLSPIDAYRTALRSGVPKFNSDIFPRMDYASNGYPASSIPRRMAISAPSPTDQMYDILINTYEEQGLSIGSSGGVLNTERLWMDEGAPQWGEGPQL